MGADMTEMTRASYQQAASGLLTVQEAVAFLEKEAKTRTLREKLEKFAKGRDLRRLLVDGLMKNHPDMNKDSVERKVRGWLNPSGERSIRRQDAIELCFILGLSLAEADQFVAMISEERLHWRSPEEIVYIFALQRGMDYPDARELMKRTESVLAETKEGRDPDEDSFTPLIRAEVFALGSQDELVDYLRRNAGRLGRFHNYAYRLFMEMIRVLEDPRMDAGEFQLFENEHMTVRDILREYLFGENVLYAKERARASKKAKLSGEEQLILTRIQESIADNWPDETALSKMKSRSMDVTRKVLILLFLATDPGPEDVYDDEEELTPEEVFEDLHTRLDHMLALCGFSAIDPRSPFDWLILYCLCVPDMLDLDARMRDMFREMFGERESGN